MLETRYLLAIGVLVFWIIVRIFLMRRRKTLINRWRQREEAEAQQAKDTNDPAQKLEPPE